MDSDADTKVGIKFLIDCYMIALVIIILPFGKGFELKFCDSSVVTHFGCDAAPILKITCSDTKIIEQFVLLLAVLTLLFTLIYVVLSYTYIIKTILRFPPTQQRKNLFLLVLLI